MADPDRPLFADLKAETARLGAELRRMAGLRWRLARLELDAASRSVKWLAIVLAVAAIMLTTGLPLLAVCLAELLAEAAGVAQAWWLLAFGVLLLIAAALSGWLAWRRFRLRFVGLEETLEELREDLVWLQEWTKRREGADHQEATDPGPGA